MLENTKAKTTYCVHSGAVMSTVGIGPKLVLALSCTIVPNSPGLAATSLFKERKLIKKPMPKICGIREDMWKNMHLETW